RHGHDLCGTKVFRAIDLTSHHATISETYMFRPDTEDEIAFRHGLTGRRNGNFAFAEPDYLCARSEAVAKWQEVHRGRTDEIRDKQGCRPIIDVARAGDLLHD